MKKLSLNIMAVTMLLSLSGCNDWLDVEPSDQVSSQKLFESGEGFRNALNGIYMAMSSPELYGRELSWGLASVLSQTYDNNDISSSKAYGSAIKYDYGETEIKGVLESVWSKGYNVIANCNKLITEAEAKDSTAFREGAIERNLIIGEAKALRALMHFDLLRLFAPSVATGDESKRIPYFTTYPSKYEPNLSTKEVLHKVEQDLLEASHLVADHDTIVNKITMGNPEYRMGGANQATGGSFFGQRGIRMNFVAINALLARAYLYDNDLDNAGKYAKYVIDNFSTRKNWFYFTDYYDYTYVEDNEKFIKLYEDIFLAFYDRKLLDNIADFKMSNYGQLMTLKNSNSLFEQDEDDYRTYLITSDGKGGQTSLKWLNLKSTVQSVMIQNKLIPVIRLSEMYYILSEASAQTDLPKALDYLAEVRNQRGTSRDISGTSASSYYNELAAECKKEFLTEGQMFFFFKRWNTPVTSGTQIIQMADKFVLPIPESEIIY